MSDTSNAYLAPQPLSPHDEKLWATLVHIGGIFFGFLPAAIGYLVLKDRGAFIRSQTVTALNFQITMLIAYAIGIITSFIVIGLFILLAVGVVTVVFSILAAVEANKGVEYSYPIALRVIK